MKKTRDLSARKISMTKIYGHVKGGTGCIIGWEYAPPKRGFSYRVYLGKGKVIQTSPVQDIQDASTGQIIKTAHSLYQIEPLE